MTLRAVCLDVDDTLVDFSGAAVAALSHVLGTPVASALWREVTEHHYRRYLDGVVDFAMMQRDRLAHTVRATGAAVGVDLARLEQRRSEALTSRLRLFDDVAGCLAALRAQGLLLAAVTNSDGPYQRGKLTSVGLADAFDAVVISGEVGVAKPAAGIFERACAELGVAPAEAAHVGDKLDTDARGARDAGLLGVWLDRRGRDGALPEGVLRVHGLAELPPLLAARGA